MLYANRERYSGVAVCHYHVLTLWLSKHSILCLPFMSAKVGIIFGVCKYCGSFFLFFLFLLHLHWFHLLCFLGEWRGDWLNFGGYFGEIRMPSLVGKSGYRVLG